MHQLLLYAAATQHIPYIVKALEPIISQYGYIAVGGLLVVEDLGLPVPGETVLIAAAFYAGLGQLQLVYVILIGIVGAVVGDNIGFAIGEYGGRPLIERFGKYVFVTPERLNKAERFFARYGGRVVVVARFIDGLRQLNGIIAGLSEMRWLKFILFNVIGATLWVGTWATVGYLGGDHISTFLRFEAYLTIATITGLVGYVSYNTLKKRRTKHE